ncbi:MAG: hypothetical protein QXG05_08255 [Nitrososphaerota archaeon]
MSDEVEALRIVAERALKFQQYILRRAWGLYYAVWSLAFILWVFLPYSLSIYYPAAGAFPYLVAYTTPAIIGMAATTWIFKRAKATIELKKVAGRIENKKRPFYRRNYIYFLLFLAILSSAIIFPRHIFYLIYIAFLILVDFEIYWSLKDSFQKIPAEGYLAVLTLALSISLTAIAFILLESFVLLFLGWIPSIAGWLFCSLYSLYHAPESMVE